MDFVNFFGSFDSRDLSTEGITTLTQYTEDAAVRDIQRFLAQYEAAMQVIESELAFITDQAQFKFGSDVGGEMQPYTETGAVEATKPSGDWTVALPIRRWRSNVIYTEERLISIPLEKLARDISYQVKSNYQTRVKMVLKALMLKTNYNFDDGIFPGSELGTLAVKRLVNADSAAGSIDVNGAAVSIAALQHYFGSNAASMTVACFKSAYAKLKTVGKTNDVVVRISSSDETTVRGFAEFVPTNSASIVDPNKVYAVVQSSRAIGRLEGPDISCEVVIQPFMWSGFFFMFDRGDSKPVGIRVPKLQAYRGLRLVQDETKAAYGEMTLRNKTWEYIGGAGVVNRVNGTACKIVASTTYTDPSIT